MGWMKKEVEQKLPRMMEMNSNKEEEERPTAEKEAKKKVK
jgi:hypothetical protein